MIPLENLLSDGSNGMTYDAENRRNPTSGTTFTYTLTAGVSRTALTNFSTTFRAGLSRNFW